MYHSQQCQLQEGHHIPVVSIYLYFPKHIIIKKCYYWLEHYDKRSQGLKLEQRSALI